MFPSFAQIGFCHERPVQIVSPYSIPPGKLRREWMEAFAELKSEGKLSEMPYLLYWFDSFMTNDPNECVELHPCSDFVSYQDGVEKRYDLLPRKIQNKYLNNEELDSEDEIMIEGTRKMQKAVELPIEQRLLPFDSDVPDPDLFAVVPSSHLLPLPVTAVTKRKDWTKTPPPVETHVAVYCDKKKEYSNGYILKQHREFFLICYDDSKIQQWVPLMDQKFNILNDNEQELPQVKKEMESMQLEIQEEQNAENPVGDSASRRVSMFPSEHEAKLDQIQATISKDTQDQPETNMIDVASRNKAKKSASRAKQKTTVSARKAQQAKDDRKARTLPDGCLKPKKEPRRLPDGSFAKPAGRCLKGFEWDFVRGVWSPTRNRRLADELSQAPPKKAKTTQPTTSLTATSGSATSDPRASGQSSSPIAAATATPTRTIAMEVAAMSSGDKSEEASIRKASDKEHKARYKSEPMEIEHMASDEYGPGDKGEQVVIQRVASGGHEVDPQLENVSKKVKTEPAPVDEEQLRHVKQLRDELVELVPMKDSLDDASAERCRKVLKSLHKLPFDGSLCELYLPKFVKKFRKHSTLGSLAQSLLSKWKGDLTEIKISEWKDAVDEKDTETAKEKLKLVNKILQEGNLPERFVESVAELPALLSSTTELFDKNKIVCQELLGLEHMLEDDDALEEKCLV